MTSNFLLNLIAFIDNLLLLNSVTLFKNSSIQSSSIFIDALINFFVIASTSSLIFKSVKSLLAEKKFRYVYFKLI